MATALSEISDGPKRVMDTYRPINTSDKENDSQKFLKHGLQIFDR